MAPVQSMSVQRLTDNQYEDGEIYQLDPSSALGQALLSEQWLNIPSDHRIYWLSEMYSPRVKFVGTVLSQMRQQVELTFIYRNSIGNTGHEVSFCVSLENFSRFFPRA